MGMLENDSSSEEHCPLSNSVLLCILRKLGSSAYVMAKMLLMTGCLGVFHVPYTFLASQYEFCE